MMFDDSIAPLVAALQGIRSDFESGLLELEGEIDLDDYLATMIDKPLADIDAARNSPGIGQEHLVLLEDAGRALAADMRNGVVVSASPEITSGDYAETVMGRFGEEVSAPKI